MPDIVYTNVESVIPDAADAQANVALLGVSIAVQLAKFPDQFPAWGVASLFRPWTWTFDSWYVFGWNGTKSQWDPLVDAKVYPQPSDEDTAWNPAMQQIMANVKQAELTIVGSTEAVDASPSTNIKIDNDSFQPNSDSIAKVNKLASLLLNLASAPYPIPEKLRMTCFIRVSNSNGYKIFIALPKFKIGSSSTFYDPSNQPPSATLSPWEITVNGLRMHSVWSAPESPGLVGTDLWLQAAIPADKQPLIANWQAQLTDVLGPYFDAAHLLTTTAWDPDFTNSLQQAIGANLTQFRACVLQGLYALVNATGKPGAAAAYPANWPTLLQTCFPSDTAKPCTYFGALCGTSPVDFPTELSELRGLVAAACSGGNLAALMKGCNRPVPSSFDSAEMAPALLGFLQSLLAASCAAAIAQAVATSNTASSQTVPTMLKAVFVNLRGVARDNLMQQLQVSWAGIPAALIDACFPDPSAATAFNSGTTALHDSIFKLALGTIDPGNQPALSANPAPLVLPALNSPSIPPADTATDPLRGFRGVGLMLQRAGTPGTWTSPSIAAPVTTPPAQQSGASVPTGAPGCAALVAAQLAYDRNLLTGTLLYNNGPLACEDLLHNYLDDEDRLQHVDVTGSLQQGTSELDTTQIPGSPIVYASYEGGGRLASGTTGLRAGAQYNFATFVITNSGALPTELRDQYPARFKPGAPPKANVSSVSYYRTVPVGGLDTCDERGNLLTNSTSLFPAIPANVWPRAAGTEAYTGGVGIQRASSTLTHPTVLLLTQSPQKYPSPPISQARQQFNFSVRLPSVDPRTWDTTFGWSVDMDSRIKVLDTALTLLKQRMRAPITDPLITSVDFTLYRWRDALDGEATPKWGEASKPFSFDRKSLADAGPGTMPVVQTVPIFISIDGDAGTVSLQPTSLQLPPGASSLVLGADGSPYPLKPGEVYLLESRLFLNLTSTDQKQMMPLYAQGSDSSGNPLPPCVVGYQLLIEIATSEMPTDLLGPLTIDLLPLNGVSEQQVRFRTAVATTQWRNVQRVDFLRQMWAWTGRTQPVVDSISIDKWGPLLETQFFPANKSEQLDDPVAAAWELIEFADRSMAQDHIESASAFKPGTSATDPTQFEYTLGPVIKLAR